MGQDLWRSLLCWRSLFGSRRIICLSDPRFLDQFLQPNGQVECRCCAVGDDAGGWRGSWNGHGGFRGRRNCPILYWLRNVEFAKVGVHRGASDVWPLCHCVYPKRRRFRRITGSGCIFHLSIEWLSGPGAKLEAADATSVHCI